MSALDGAGIRLVGDDVDPSLIDLQVLVFAHERNKGWVEQILARRGPPTIVLAADASLQEWALERARDCDDVDSLSSPAQLVVARLKQSLRRVRSTHVMPAELDPLTGLLSRRGIEREWRALDDASSEYRIFLLDLDHFKAINDRYGHAVGDEVLCQVASRLKRQLGEQALLVRFGGEEFCWVAPRCSDQEANALAESVLEVIREPMLTAGGTIQVTASIGHCRGQVEKPLATQVHGADLAVYEAKAAGRNRVVAFADLQRQAAEDDEDLKLVHFQNVAQVVTQRTANLLANFGKDLVRTVRRDADQDKLTQLWNRRYFDRRFERELKMAQEQKTPLSIAVFDLDHFGEFNRQHGMPTADAVLAAFGRLAKSCIRASDWMARYGGEEFVLVVRGPVQEAARAAERIRSELEQLDITSPTGQQVRTTVSVGIAELCPGTPVEASALIQEGSKRVQQAKQAGRNRVVST